MTTANIVPAAGSQPNTVLVVGEAPGREEFARLQPFVGKSGDEQQRYLRRHGLNVNDWRRTNVVPVFTPGNPDPTRAQIDEWTPTLLAEIAATQPKLIVAVGRFAMRWLLGDAAQLDVCQGLPHEAGAFDETRRDRACGAVVVPVQHPASGFYDGDARALISRDYGAVATTLARLQRGETIDLRRDGWAGREQYVDVDGETLCALVDALPDDAYIGYDTEGVVGAEWSLQVSPCAGTAWALRRSRDDFAVGAAAVQRAANRGVTFIAHNLMHDMPVSRAMGVELSRAHIVDTMYMAFALKLEPQALKSLAWRWNGRKRRSYSEVVGDAGTRKQVAYLVDVMTRKWAMTEPRVIVGNDGVIKVYRPQGAAKRALSILRDYTDEIDADNDSDDETLDIYARWKQVDRELRLAVESVIGVMPVGTLDDIPLNEAVEYAAADADDEIRLYPRLLTALREQGLERVVERGMLSMPSFERIQATGMPASRSKLLAFRDDVRARMSELQAQISVDYWDGEPFNPASHVHVAALLKKRKLKPAKLTGTGKASTGKASIEHLRFTDDAVAAVISWRELAKMEMFGVAGESLDAAGDDVQYIHGQVKLTRIPSRRIAMSDYNLVQIPTRHELGKQLKACYVAPPGKLLGSWDLGGIEMRVAAHLANDELMCKLFNDGLDVHSEVAAMIFGLPLVDDADPKVRYQHIDEKRHRYPAKRAGFGSLYGIGGEGLYTQLRQMPGCDGWDAKSCEKLIRDWFGVYKGIKREIDDTAKWVRERGYVEEPMTKARRYLPGIWSDDKHVRGEAERQAFNHRVQGMAQTMLQESMIYLWDALEPFEQLGDIEWCLQQHDELIFAFDESMWPLMDAVVTDALINYCGVTLRVPVAASGHAAQSWDKLK